MFERQTALEKARQLAEAGRHAEVVGLLSEWPREQIEESPSLSLLYGTAQARLGRHDEGGQWVERALKRACEDGDRRTQTRALNARGAIAFVAGRIDEAADYFTQALLSASRDGDHATIGRCSNNLGIIANLRGRQAEAIGSYSMAVAAFERAGLRQGVAEARHNLGITYREQEKFDRALREAQSAQDHAIAAGDRTLAAMTVRGRAEIRVHLGEVDLARHEIEEALETHRSLGDHVEEAQDLRIGAAIQAVQGELEAAEQTLRDVVARAVALGRPQLVAEGQRDLAYLLRNAGRQEEALEAAKSSIRLFEQLGAEAEIRKLDSLDWGYPLANELQRSLAPVHEAQRLADMGRYTELVAHLGERSPEELQRSPTLALLSGIGHARLGRLDEAWQWIMIALSRARIRGDRVVEVRALNVYGAVALERGGIDEATYFFTHAQAEAMRDGDLATVGRCANNLGIIANLQGDYGRAVGAYTMAIAAYQRAGLNRGVAETEHNLGITYRELGDLVEAMGAADRAVDDAERLGDTVLQAQVLAGRAEIRVARGEPEIAIREAERAIVLHRQLNDAVRETEDLRILGLALACAGKTADAEATLRSVIERATAHARPLLVATAQRDLARALAKVGRLGEARDLAGAARETFRRLCAKVEVAKLEQFLAGISPTEAEAA
jgi:tetratricopeptide (TPR) repeat protein